MDVEYRTCLSIQEFEGNLFRSHFVIGLIFIVYFQNYYGWDIASQNSDEITDFVLNNIPQVGIFKVFKPFDHQNEFTLILLNLNYL